MKPGMEKRRSPRLPVRAVLRFRPIAKVCEGVTVDLSAQGLKGETSDPLRVIMVVAVGKEAERRVARLVWAKRTASGAMSYGFEFDASAEAELNAKSG